MPTTSDKKPTPEQLLQQPETEEERQATGRFKIFLELGDENSENPGAPQQ
jgi:hypothetical protein